MINHTTKETIAEGIKLHMVHSKKFKTILFGLYIKRPLRTEEVALNALLSRVIDQSTAHYQDSQAISQALEMNFGTLIVSDVHKYGEKQMIQIKAQIPGMEYVEDPLVYRNVFQLLNDMINHPRMIENGFDPDLFRREQEALIAEIKQRKDQKNSWVMTRCIEAMFEGEPYAIHELGTVEMVEAINPKQLMEHLLKVWTESEIDICVIGDFGDEKMRGDILESFEFKRGQIEAIQREKVMVNPLKVRRIDEPHDIAQGKICMGYRLNVPYESPLYIAAVVGNIVLGGGGSSKLFKNIREKESLCYSIYSHIEKHVSVLMVNAGVDFDKFDRVEVLVTEQVDAIRRGMFDSDELESAKKIFISNLQSLSDYPNSYMNFYYNMMITEGEVDVEQYIKRIEAVTSDMVCKAFEEIQLDSVVRLTQEVS